MTAHGIDGRANKGEIRMDHQIEIVSVRKIEGTGNLRAFVDIRVYGTVVITQCAIMDGKRGLFAIMPRQLSREGLWRDVVIVADDKVREAWQEAILEAYEEATATAQ